MKKPEELTFRQFVTHIFMSDTGVSSKRVAGIIGWLVCLFVCVYCTILTIAAPVIIETLFYCTAALLGLDSITSIWKHKDNSPPEKEVENEKPKKEK